MDIETRRRALINHLMLEGYIKSPKVRNVMENMPRELFIPEELQGYAYVDRPLDIGQGQTISAPHMVAIMLEELMLEPGHSVLEIGGGSGYHASLVAKLVGLKGKVTSIERIGELAEFARANTITAGQSGNVDIVHGDGSCGYGACAPYDRIMVTCAAPSVPPPLVAQLKTGGMLLIPVGSRYTQELVRITNRGGRPKKENLGGCVFVPLLGRFGFDK